MALAAAALTLPACGIDCTLQACVAGLTIVTDDASGFVAGTLRAGEDVITFDCETEPSAGPIEVADLPVFLHCGSQSTTFENLLADSVQLEVSDPEGRRFAGTLTPQYETEEDFGGPGCGSCTTGRVNVTLR
jgi:hypothetical protein